MLTKVNIIDIAITNKENKGMRLKLFVFKNVKVVIKVIKKTIKRIKDPIIFNLTCPFNIANCLL